MHVEYEKFAIFDDQFATSRKKYKIDTLFPSIANRTSQDCISNGDIFNDRVFLHISGTGEAIARHQFR